MTATRMTANSAKAFLLVEFGFMWCDFWCMHFVERLCPCTYDPRASSTQSVARARAKYQFSGSRIMIAAREMRACVDHGGRYMYVVRCTA